MKALLPDSTLLIPMQNCGLLSSDRNHPPGSLPTASRMILFPIAKLFSTPPANHFQRLLSHIVGSRQEHHFPGTTFYNQQPSNDVWHSKFKRGEICSDHDFMISRLRLVAPGKKHCGRRMFPSRQFVHGGSEEQRNGMVQRVNYKTECSDSHLHEPQTHSDTCFPNSLKVPKSSWQN